MIILIIASDNDLHANHIAELLKNNKVLRICPNSFLESDFEIKFYSNVNCRASLKHEGKIYYADEIKSIFCRDLNFTECLLSESLSTQLEYYERKSAAEGFLKVLRDIYWMNNPWNDDFADNKLFQQHEAFLNGFLIPPSLTTNSPEAFLEFFSIQEDVIIKQLSDISLIDDSELELSTSYDDAKVYGFYTSKVELSHIDKIEAIRQAPCLFQKHIIKKSDIRVTYVDGDCFSVEIDSQSDSRSLVDFRHVYNLPMKHYDFPDDLKKKLGVMLKSWGLKFAACDFILTDTGDLIFIEANVAGNWLWIEKKMNLNISECIANKLIFPRDEN